ncbi:prolyl oligopeptidase family serine peptidase [Ancylobacter sp. 6x-1]|uniref:Prolyl oligopeptidase family serine peptidase n=1 Tax=Ancylobacter crimeensis TaxID=2579147 RepID=A0ABT0DDN4_9HYPH|nr:PHB depolymerase family esterase [Ancylobacter crimeensis]MCK0198076.1 prolyl oligopeptidase family serine peptidase [Ancylobacter crimeensis]
MQGTKPSSTLFALIALLLTGLGATAQPLPVSPGGAGGGAGDVELSSPIPLQGPANLPTPVSPFGDRDFRPGGSGQTFTILSGGRRREFILRVPAGSPAAGPRPLVIALHGAWQPAGVFQSYLDLDTIADREGFVVAYPKGINLLWNDGRGSVAGIMPIVQKRDDGAFVLDVLDALVGQGIADPSRAYLMGFSNGGFLTAYMACRYADRFAAFATMMMTVPEGYAQSCRPSRPVPILLMNGTYDPIVPTFGRPTPGAELLSARDTAQLFARLNGCEPPQGSQRGGARITRWSPCAQGSEVAFYEIQGGHQPPAGSVGPMDALASLVLGPRRSGLDAPDEIWSFFRAFTLPPAAQPAPFDPSGLPQAGGLPAAALPPLRAGAVPLPPPSPLRAAAPGN